MLILTRKPGDAILIDGGIRVVVLASDPGSVRIGIEAPAAVGIVREELARRIADENRRAGATPEQRAWVEALGGSGEGGEAPGGAGEGTPSPAAGERASDG